MAVQPAKSVFFPRIRHKRIPQNPHLPAPRQSRKAQESSFHLASQNRKQIKDCPSPSPAAICRLELGSRGVFKVNVTVAVGKHGRDESLLSRIYLASLARMTKWKITLLGVDSRVLNFKLLSRTGRL